MTLLSPPHALGASGQLLSGKLLRLTRGATWRPSSTALGAVSGVLHGPAGSMMEGTLVNPTTLGVNPGVAVIQGTLSGDQGQYETANDAYATFTITGQDASQFRRALWLIEVNDSQASGVASTATTDRARMHLLDGPLSASNPGPLPTVPANSLVLGEVAIPPTGQTVTLTQYNPRTGVRGALMPVLDDAVVLPGHGGQPGAYLGDTRFHPTRGIEVWTQAGQWQSHERIGYARLFAYATAARAAFATGWQDIDLNSEDLDTHGAHITGAGLVTGQRHFTCPAGQAGRYKVGGGVTFDNFPAGSTLNSRVMRNNAVFRGCTGSGITASSNGSSSVTGEKIVDLAVGNTVHIQGFCSGGPWSTGVYTDGGSWMAVERID